MKQKHLIILLSIFALVVSSFMIAGNVGAMYMGDGSTQNGTTGEWNKPTDGVCVLSIDINGNMLADYNITNKRDCDARLVSVTAVTAGDTLANVCGNPTKNTAGAKYAAPGSSTCVTVDGSGNITGSKSMVNLDRGNVMCNLLGGQLANATVGALPNGGAITVATNTKANGTSAQCIAYGWQYRGQDTAGNPLPFGSTGTAQTSNTGFCYTSMRTSLAATACPTVVGSTTGTANSSASAAFGYSVSGSYCLYAYGINGTLNAALTKIDGTTAAAAGASFDLSTFNTMGACLANGGTWSNWIPVGSTATVGALNGITNAVAFDLARQAVN